MPPAEGHGTRRPLPIERRLGTLHWPVMGRLAVHPSGEERSRELGHGLEYADAREYMPGDDPRLIDWNLSARSGRTFLRLAHPDRGLDVWLLVDTSASLDWGTARCLKREAAADLVVAASLLLSRRGNRVGAVLFDEQIQHVLTPTVGRQARAALIAAARKAPSTDRRNTDLAGTLTRMGKIIRRPSLVVLVSDFLGSEDWQLPLRGLGLRHELVVAVISDPREEEIPDVGLVTFEDPESGRQLAVDTRDQKLRQRFKAAAAERRRSLDRDLASARAVTMRISTQEDVLVQLMRLFASIDAHVRGRARSAAR